MLNIRVDDVPVGSHKFRIFEGKYGESPFIMSGIIEPDGKGGCEITNVQGDMSNEANELMAITVRDMGYEYLTFKVLKGTHVTRYAIKENSDEMFDYYMVPLFGQKTKDGK